MISGTYFIHKFCFIFHINENLTFARLNNRSPMLGTFEEIAIRGIVNDHFSVLSGCVLLKKFENEKSLPHILLVVFIIGFSNLIIISTKRLKRTKKIFTHNLPRVLPTIWGQPIHFRCCR